MGDVGSVLPNVVSPMVAEGAPLADRVDKLLIDSVGCLPWLRPGGRGVSRLLLRTTTGVEFLPALEGGQARELPGFWLVDWGGVYDWHWVPGDYLGDAGV